MSASLHLGNSMTHKTNVLLFFTHHCKHLIECFDSKTFSSLFVVPDEPERGNRPCSLMHHPNYVSSIVSAGMMVPTLWNESHSTYFGKLY